jgi:YfiH family protein
MTAPAETVAAFRRWGELEVLTWPAFDAFDVDAGVTTRSGGVSSGSYATLNLSLHVGDSTPDVLENRRRVAAALGASPGDFVFCNQSHGRNVTIVSAGDRGRGALSLDDAIPGTDALVTREPGVVLAVMAADCVPIVLLDPVVRVLACVHAGWRGTIARAAAAAVEVMQSLGTRPADVIAGIGPAIAPDRYQVGPEVAEAAEQAFGASAPGATAPGPSVPGGSVPGGSVPGGSAGSVIRPDGTGRWLFDLWTANRLVLCEAGVPDDQIHVTDIPTGDGRFFSDRAERPCGRLALVARLRGSR